MTTKNYDFDVALSYASEDRAYVSKVADGLRSAGVRVFYDEFMVEDLWGVDLYDYLNDIYFNRARFTVLFSSSNYIAKTWTSHERKSAQARALAQAGPYLLPVRLDDAVLPGITTTVSYIDGRRTSATDLVAIIGRKLDLDPADPQVRDTEAEATFVRDLGIPQTSAKKRSLLAERPAAWEYILWATVMWERKEELEAKWFNHELRVPSPNSHVVNSDNLRQFPSDTVNYFSDFLNRLNRIFSEESQEWALGAAGQPGDPVRIDHYAKQLMALYEELLDWAASLRGTRARPEYRQLVEIAARFADLPLAQIREFVDSFVEQISILPARIAAGEVVNFHLTLKIDIDNSVTDAFLKEYERVLT